MNLLLLLSVLLSALTGAGAAARPVAPATLAAPVTQSAAVAARRVAPKQRPAAQVANRPAVSRAPLSTALVLAAAEPRYATRRRE